MRHLLKALPELVSAGVLYALWAEPERFGTDWFKSGVLALLLEFLVIHASGFMAVLMYDPETDKAKRSLQIGGLGAFYLLFVGLFAWSLEALWMVWAFAWLLGGKLAAIWTEGAPRELDRSVAISSWALAVAVYLGCVWATAMLDVPRLGVTDEVRAAGGFDANSTGIWESEPWRALAAAVLYFAIMGLSRPLFAYWQAVGR